MYTAIYEAHRGFAMLGVALTVVKAALAVQIVTLVVVYALMTLRPF
jgi:hypothetical protein